MKYLKFLILLMLPFVGFAQNDKPTKQHKFGVGLGYNFNSVMGDTIRPLEVSFRYKLNDKHTFQLYSPIRLKRYKNYPDNRPKGITSSENLWGLGGMYDYSFFRHNNIEIIGGLNASWQKMKTDNFKNYSSNDFNMIEEWQKNRESFYFGLPVGIRYLFNNFGIEIYYTPRLSLLKIKEKGTYRGLDYDTDEEWISGSYDVPLEKYTVLENSVHCSIFYYF